MPDSIPGTPEGRPGVWLLTSEVACAIVEDHFSPDEKVHNFLSGGTGPVLIGANWSQTSVLAKLREPGLRLAIIFPPNVTVKHQLVALSDEKRWAFDVGEIPESRMVKEPDHA